MGILHEIVGSETSARNKRAITKLQTNNDPCLREFFTSTYLRRTNKLKLIAIVKFALTLIESPVSPLSQFSRV